MEEFNGSMETLAKELQSAWDASGMTEEQKQERMAPLMSRMLDVLRDEIKRAGMGTEASPTQDASPVANLRPTRSLPVDGTPPLGAHNVNDLGTPVGTPKTASKRPPLAGDSPATGGKKRRLVPQHTPRSKYVNVNVDSSKLDNIQWFYKGAPSPSSSRSLSRV